MPIIGHSRRRDEVGFTAAIWFAASRVFVATRPRVGGVVPRLTRSQVLWKADQLYVKN